MLMIWLLARGSDAQGPSCPCPQPRHSCAVEAPEENPTQKPE